MGFFTTLTEAHPPNSRRMMLVALVACATITGTFGYDGSMMNGLNILPSYLGYFEITTATKSLSTSAIYIGGILAGSTFPYALNRLGRRMAMLLSAVLTIFFVALQAGAINMPMFIAARIGLGYGKACPALVVPIYLAEAFPPKYRGWVLSLVCDFYYVGALIAAGVTYGTFQLTSTWAWRLPSLLQGFWSLLCISVLSFLPESPRWYAFQGRNAEGLRALAQLCSGGDENDPSVILQFQEILDTIEFEKTSDTKQLSIMQVVRSPSARRRVALAASVAFATVASGNSIASYYLGDMLSNAGITDADTQLQINVILNAWCLVCSLAGTYYVNSVGRRLDALVSTVLLTIFLFLVGAFTKIYGHSDNKSGIYATVAFVFLFMSSYSVGWTPLCYLYPPEVLNYTLRSYGMGITLFVMYGVGLIFVFSIPFALNDIGWKTYMINGAWNCLLILFIYFFWVETNGKTLEEIDAAFEGRHSDVVIDSAVIKAKLAGAEAEHTLDVKDRKE
ncbi:hypothetical protein LRP88_07432 [Fusarium phalaenopsidis]|nr:hypothetical protein NCS56_00007600 [Fusarium sp. Ph1]